MLYKRKAKYSYLQIDKKEPFKSSIKNQSNCKKRLEKHFGTRNRALICITF